MLIYFIFALAAVGGSALVLLSMHIFGVADINVINKLKIKSGSALKKKIEEEKSAEPDDDSAIDEEDSKLFGNIFCAVLFVLSIIAMFIISLVLNRYVFDGEITPKGCFSFVKLFVVFAIVEACAMIDFKKRIIPNKIVALGLIFRLIIYVGEIFLCRDIIKDIVINDLIGFAIGFGILFLTGLISGGAMGFGDAKLFAVIGLCAGSLCTFGTLIFSLLCSAVIGIALLIKYRDKKMAFPFAPCIFVGYAAVLLIGNF